MNTEEKACAVAAYASFAIFFSLHQRFWDERHFDLVCSIINARMEGRVDVETIKCICTEVRQNLADDLGIPPW